MGAIKFAPGQRLVGFHVPLDIIRMSELVKNVDRADLLGGATEHAPVCGVDRYVPIVDLRDSDSQLGAFKYRAEFLLTFADGALESMALRDIQKGDHAANRLAVPEQWMRPVFDREGGAITAPEDLVIGMGVFPGAIGVNNLAVLHGERSPIGVRMMEQQMAV